MNNYIDHFNNGVLPFVGRSLETEKLVEFWQRTVDAAGLRVALLIGETGIGKTRLIEHVIPRITDAGGFIAHIRLYPESASAVVPLLARALVSTATGRMLLKQAPEATITAVTGALRRVARLRPTLVVIENVHLLQEGALREFAALLSALANETISVLCATRPVELPARSAIGPYLTDEITLSGLNEQELGSLWVHLFGSEYDPGAMTAIRVATAGNALAVRLAIRGAIKSGMIAIHPASGGWEVSVPLATLNKSLQQSANALSENITLQLTDAERHHAVQLAVLGEVFSAESASVMLGNVPNVLQDLSFKGVIAAATLHPTPITHPSDHHPLYAFTHTLVHHHFAGHGKVNAERLLDVVVRELPIYSVLPYEHLAGLNGGAALPPEPMKQGVLVMSQTAARLNSTPDWKLSQQIGECCQSIYERYRTKWSDEDRLEIWLRLLELRLWLLDRYPDAKETAPGLIREFLELTARQDTESIAASRMRALGELVWSEFATNYQRVLDSHQELGILRQRYPALGTHDAYFSCLNIIAQTAALTNDEFTLEAIERELSPLHLQRDLPASVVKSLRQDIPTHFLLVFNSQEQLAERRDFIRRLKSSSDTFLPHLEITCLHLLLEIGEIDRVIELADLLIPLYHRYGYLRNPYSCMIDSVSARTLRGDDLNGILEDTLRFCGQVHPSLADMLRGDAIVNLIPHGILRNEFGWANSLIAMLDRESDDQMPLEVRMSLAFARGATRQQLQELARNSTERRRKGAELLTLLGILSSDTAGDAAAGIHARSLLDAPPLRVADILLVRTVIDLLRWSDGLNPQETARTAQFHENILGAVRRILDWCAEPQRRMPDVMEGLLEAYGDVLPETERAQRRKQAGSLRSERERERLHRSAITQDGRQTMSMLGTISLNNGTQTTVVRGARVRSLLGVMVADRMLVKRLDRNEFARLATGDNDPESSRNNLRVALHRTRELLGPAGILSEGQNPTLNPDVIRVDLLEAHTLLSETIQALGEGNLMKALAALIKALGIIGTEVPFPSLYDTFFEAMREDFENSLRSIVLDAAVQLLQEEDPANAELLLHHALTTIPGDEDIIELLHRALLMSGKRTEADRLKRRNATTEA